MSGPRGGAVIAIEPEGIEIPPGIHDLESFRAWARSDGFPERGRIDWVAGRLEVDLSPEDLYTHGTPKSAIAAKLVLLVQEPEEGLVFIDSTRVSSPEAELSAEPDVLVVLAKSLATGRVKLIPKASGEEDRFVEIEGAPDLVVECVSDASAVKDLDRLPRLYHRAGVREYWIVDARGAKVSLRVFIHRPRGYARAHPGAKGFVRSSVLGRAVRLVRRKKKGLVFFRLELGAEAE